MSKRKLEKTFRYSSNNSGGDWWLKDKDWIALEKAGWTVHWVQTGETGVAAYSKVKMTQKRHFPFHGTCKNAPRWLGALATSAAKKFHSFTEAKDEWERITGQSLDAEGCPCCGRPHDIDEQN